MSAEDRLVAAMQTIGVDPLGAAIAALREDPSLAQDIADGQALRLLREALERRAYNAMLTFRDGDIWYVDVTDPAGPDVDSDSYVLTVDGATIAEAADACRSALGDRS